MDLSHASIVAYLSNLADQNTDVKSFFRMNISEIQGAIKTNIEYPCLALESHEGNFESSSANNTIEQKTFAFSILDKPVKHTFNGENDSLDLAEKIGKEFLARMRYDTADPNSELYQAFNISRVSYHKVGPIYADRLFGYRFEIPLNSVKANLKPNPDKWSDLNTIC